MFGGGDSLSLKFWVQLTALDRKRRLSVQFRASQTDVELIQGSGGSTWGLGSRCPYWTPRPVDSRPPHAILK